MRFTKLFAAVLCSLAALAASGQNLRDEIAANPGKSGGVYYVYTYDNPVLTPALRITDDSTRTEIFRPFFWQFFR